MAPTKRSDLHRPAARRPPPRPEPAQGPNEPAPAPPNRALAHALESTDVAGATVARTARLAPGLPNRALLARAAAAQASATLQRQPQAGLTELPPGRAPAAGAPEAETEGGGIVTLLTTAPLYMLGAIVAGPAILLVPRSTMVSILRSVDPERAARIVTLAGAAGAMPMLAPALIALGPERLGEIVRHIDRRTLEPLMRSSEEFAKAIALPALDAIWPVGLGYELDAGAGVTWGIPLYTGALATFALHRENQDNFVFRRRGEAREAFDTGVGAGASIGGAKKGGDSSKAGPSLGASAYAGVQAGLKQIVFQLFRFPVFKDAAFFPMLVAVSGADTGMAFNLGKYLSDTIASLDPNRYLEQTKIELKAYGEGIAGAGGGLRSGLEQAKAAGGAAPAQPGSSLRRSVLEIATNLYAELIARAGVEAGVGMELQTVRDEAGQPTAAKLSVYVEASAAGSLTAFLVNLGIPIAAFAGGGGVKLTWDITEENPDPPIDRPSSWSLYGKQGEVDEFHTGPASLVELTMKSLSPDAFASVQDFLDNVESADLKFRLQAGGTYGSRFVRNAAAHGTSFGPWLRRHYGAQPGRVGLRIEAYLDVAIKLDADQLRLLANAVVAAADATAAAGSQQALADLETFLKTGTLPPVVAAALELVADTLYASLEKLSVHAAIGGVVAAQAQVAAGAKARAHGHLGGAQTIDADLKPLLGGELGPLDVAKLLFEAAFPTVALVTFTHQELVRMYGPKPDDEGAEEE